MPTSWRHTAAQEGLGCGCRGLGVCGFLQPSPLQPEQLDLADKAQETIGNITGDKKDQLEGKAKQAQASGDHAVEDLKDAVRSATD